MARIKNNKDYDMKKDQILQKSLELLAKDGYEKFSINKVIKTSEMTKGAFFHYFKSKEELIYGMLEQLTSPVIDAVTKVANMDELEPKTKVIKLFQAAYRAKNIKNPHVFQFAKLIYLEENTEILNLFTKEVTSRCVPIFEKVFREGIEKEVFQFAHPHGTAFYFLGAISDCNEAIGRVLIESDSSKINWNELKEKVKAFNYFGKKLFSLTELDYFYDEEILEMLDMQSNLKKSKDDDHGV